MEMDEYFNMGWFDMKVYKNTPWKVKFRKFWNTFLYAQILI